MKMEKRIIDTGFGKVVAGVAAITAAAGLVAVAALSIAGRPPIGSYQSSIIGMVVGERYDMGGNYRIIIKPDTEPDSGIGFYELAFTAAREEAEKVRSLDDMISPGTGVVVSGLKYDKMFNRPFHPPISPEQVKVVGK